MDIDHDRVAVFITIGQTRENFCIGIRQSSPRGIGLGEIKHADACLALIGQKGGDAIPRLGGHGQFGQVEKRPVEGLRQLLEEHVLGQAALTANKSQQ